MGWFRFLIRTLPKTFRDVRGAELLDHLEDELADARRGGLRRLAVFGVSATANLLVTAVTLRVGPPPVRGVEPGAPHGCVGGDGDRSAASLVEILWQDAKQALRGVRSRPQVAVLVVVTLALGVGMNTAIYAVVDGILLRPLAYEQPERLVHVAARISEGDIESAHVSAGDVADMRRAVPSFESIAGAAGIRQNLTGSGLVPTQIRVGWTTADLFETLGVTTALGRPFTASDPPGTALLSYESWRTMFGADPDVLGRAVRLDGHPHTVVGVLPRGFRLHVPGFGERDIWKNPDDFWQNGDVWSAQGPSFGLLDGVARLREGASLDQARAELDAVTADLRKRFPEYERLGYELTATGLHDRATADTRPGLLVLAGAVAFLLVIACANVANLLLVRAHARHRELVVRLALGSPRRRVARLVLFESLILALLGGAAGALVAVAATRVFQHLGPALPLADRVEPDPGLLAFALAVSAGCAMVVGMIPALGASRSNAAEVLRRGRGSRQGLSRLGHVLVTGQISLSLVLLIGAGLLTRSFVRLHSIDPGFETEGLLTFSVTLPGNRYERPVATDRFLRELQARLADLPGVRSAGVGWPMPLTRSLWRGEYRHEGDGREQTRLADYRVTTEEYFEVLEVPLLEGRTFGSADPPGSVVVGRTVAEASWPGESPVGRTLLANPWGGEVQPYEVIGVVDDLTYGDLRDPSPGALYFDTRAWSWNDWEFYVLARTEGEPLAALPAVRSVLMEMDAEVPVADASTMDALKADQFASNRFALALMSLFSVVAATMAFVGLYGLMSYSVRTRRPELGIRIALGSGRTGITRLVLGEGLRLTAWGVVVGVLASLALTRLMTGWLYAVEPSDLGTYVALSLTVCLVAATAAALPALRASRLEPASVLQTD